MNSMLCSRATEEMPAGIPDLTAQSDVGQEDRVRVDLIQSVEHGLHPLDAVLLP